MTNTDGATQTSLSRRAFAKGVGLGFVGAGMTGAGAAASSETERRVVGTDSKYGTDMVVQQSAAVEKTVELGEIGDAIVGQFDPETTKQLEGADGIRYVERDVDVEFPDRAVERTSQSSSVTPQSQLMPWGCERIGAMSLHTDGATGDGVDVAIIDSGVDSDHPDLQGNLGEGYAVTSCGGDDCQNPWDDDHSHGSHCAGIVGALDNARGVVGVAPSVTLHAVKVMTAAGTGTGSDIADGIVWATDQGYDVANISLGATSPSSIIHDAVKYAEENGMLVVAAAGNEGPCSDCLHYPGAFEETLCVGAINDEDELASYSSTGGAVDIVGPGTAIPSTVIDGDYMAFSGTSMATPHVVGAAAMLVQDGYSPKDAKQQLLDTAEGLGLEESESGAGLVDCVAALSDGDDGGEQPTPTAAVRTDPVDGVEASQATFDGTLTGLENADSATVGFEYWVEGDESGTETRTETTERTEPGSFSRTVEGLNPDTTYVVRALATPADGETVYGETVTVTTPPEDALNVTATGATDVELYGARLNGKVTSMGAAESVDAGFRYWEDGESADEASGVEAATLEETDSFDKTVVDLQSDTTYHYVAYARPEDGEEISSGQVTFTTEGTAW